MSKLHVTQIAGYLSTTMKGRIDMIDYANHSDSSQVNKAFLTRGLAALAASHLTETPIADLGSSITDGSKDGGIDLIYFNAPELTLYLVQTKWHEDGHGSMELGEVLKFIEGVKKVLDNNLEGLNERVQAKKADIERALFDANAKFMLVLAHTGQEEISEEVGTALNTYVEA